MPAIKLSRVRFVTTSAVFLAGCSGGISSLPRDANRNSSSNNFRVLSDSTGSAIAVVDADGKTIGSAAISNGILRSTGPDGSNVTFGLNASASRPTVELANGLRFKQKRLNDGTPAVLSRDSLGKKTLIFKNASGNLAIVPAIGQGSPLTIKLTSLKPVDKSEIWHGNDAFVQQARSLPRTFGIVSSRVHLDMANGGDSGIGDSSFGDWSGDSNGGSGDSFSHGDGGVPISELPPRGARDPGMTPEQQQCLADYLNLNAASAAYAVAAAALVLCATPACPVEIAALIAATLYLAAAEAQYDKDGCKK